MRKIILTFGFIAGAMLSLMFIVQYQFHDALGFGTAGVLVGYTTMVLAFLMVFVGVKTYRDDIAGGTVGFGRAFGMGLLIMFIASCCYVATWEVIYYGFSPDFLDKYAAYMLEELRASGATEAAIAETTRQMAEFKEMYKNPLVNIAFSFLEPLPVGIVMSLISAGVLSRKKRPATA